MREVYEQDNYENSLNKKDTFSHSDSYKGFSHEMSSNPDVADIDRELEELIKKQNAKIKVIGIGGG